MCNSTSLPLVPSIGIYLVSGPEWSGSSLRLFQSIIHRLWLVFLRNRLREISLDRGTSSLRVRDVHNKVDATYLLNNIRRINTFIYSIALLGRAATTTATTQSDIRDEGFYYMDIFNILHTVFLKYFIQLKTPGGAFFYKVSIYFLTSGPT